MDIKVNQLTRVDRAKKKINFNYLRVQLSDNFATKDYK